MTAIRLLNVKYSPNLGDGIIAQCLERELSHLMPCWDVRSVDLAGRVGFGDGLDTRRGRALDVLRRLPQPLRRTATAAILRVLITTRYSPVWRSALAGADAAILGGGQLFSDADLNFPLKIHHILKELRLVEGRLAVFGVGVSNHWSSRAADLFSRALGRACLVHIAVRDLQSQQNWATHFDGSRLGQPLVCRDPGLLAASVYEAANRARRHKAPVIGFGLTNPDTLALHADQATLSREIAVGFWVGLAREAVSRGFSVRLFTNGPADDEAFLSQVLGEVGDAAVSVAPRPTTPSELVSCITACDAIIAHRLHANIVAYAFEIPHVGLSWDAKLPAFFDSVGRGDFMIVDTAPSPKPTADLIIKAMRVGVDHDRHALVLSQTRAAIARCAADIAAALGQDPPSVGEPALLKDREPGAAKTGRAGCRADQ